VQSWTDYSSIAAMGCQATSHCPRIRFRTVMASSKKVKVVERRGEICH
jgi:hypothetical protein